MRSIKFLTGVVCLCILFTSCEVDPIYEDIDEINYQAQIHQEQALEKESNKFPAVDEQAAARTEGEDDKPPTDTGKAMVLGTKPSTGVQSRTEGEDDKPPTDTGKAIVITVKPGAGVQSRTEGEDDKPPTGK